MAGRPSAPAGAQSELRQKLVVKDGVTDPNFEIGYLRVKQGKRPSSEDLTVGIIGISVVGDKVLVAVPEPVWDKKGVDRVIDKTALTRVQLLAVAASSAPDREDTSAGIEVAVWIGLLKTSLEREVKYPIDGIELDEFLKELDYEFGLPRQRQGWLPVAASLVSAAQDLFEFQSAESGAGRANLESRMKALEGNMSNISSSLELLLEGHRTPDAVVPREGSVNSRSGKLLVPKSKAKKEKVPPAGVDDGGTVENLMKVTPALRVLNLEVVKSALQAGVSLDHLKEMASLVKKDKADRLLDFPKQKQKQDHLSEGEEDEGHADAEEEEEEPEGLPVESNAQLTNAISSIAQVLSAMRAEKEAARGKSALEKALEGGGATGSSGDGSLVSGSRRNASQLAALRRTLVEAPADISEAIWKLMSEDFSNTALGPGEILPGVTARGWLEHRSRIQSFPNSIRFAWTIAGIADCLRQGKQEEALARCMLALAQSDQVAVDSGSWLIAQELSLENPPPFASFSKHVLPTASEPQQTKLADARWIELVMSKVSDLETFSEKRKKLTGAKPQEGTREEQTPGAKAKAKAKREQESREKREKDKAAREKEAASRKE